MTVLHVIPTLKAGGIETQFLELIPYFQRKGVQIEILCLSSKSGEIKKEYDELGVKIHKVGEWNTLNFSAFTKILSIFSKDRFDIIHTHNRSTAVRLAAKITSKPLVVNYHNLYNPTLRGESHARKLLMFCVNKLRFLDDVSISVSKYVHNTHFHGSRISSKRRVIYNSVDVDKIDQVVEDGEKKDIYSKANVDPKSLIIGNVGRLTSQKGQRYLLEAISYLTDDWPTLKLLIIGSGPKLEELMGIRDQLGLASTVEFLGSRRDVFQLLSIMDLFAFPSLWEGLGIALVEAMAARLPVVATDVGPLPEVVEDGEHGYLVEPKNSRQLASKIDVLLESPSLRRKLGQNARGHIERKFEVQKCAEEYLKVYKKVSL